MRKLCLILFALPLALPAQKNKGRDTPPPDATRATILKVSDVYVAPDANSQKVTSITPGHEVLVVERSGPWIKVFANTDIEERTERDDEPEFSTDEATIPRSGWIRDKGIVGPGTPNGDKLIYGMAASMEAAAGEPHAPKSAAGGAHLLYRRVAEYFPNSPLAGESEWRSADIRWQEEKFDAATLPSAKDEGFMRPQLYQKALQKIVKTGTGKYPALAAYDLIDQKLCGDWQGLPKCPEMEAGVYAKYADQFPDGPKTPEALWNAAYREGVLVTMYTAEEDKKRADVAAQRAHGFRDQLVAKFPNSDYTARAVSLVYRVEQGIAVYGSDRD